MTSHLAEWLSSKRTQITNVGKDMVVEMLTGASTVENSMKVSQKTKKRTTVLPSNSTPGYILKKKKREQKH